MEEIALAYDEAAPGLGSRFLAALDRTYDQLKQFPDSAEEVLTEIRRARVAEPFPYLIYYSRQGDRLEIIAVVHGRRHERVWRHRVD